MVRPPRFPMIWGGSMRPESRGTGTAIGSKESGLAEGPERSNTRWRAASILIRCSGRYAVATSPECSSR